MDLPTHDGTPVFTVQVKPGSRSDEIVSWDGKVLMVMIAAPADKGKANERLVKYLSKELGARVAIKSGHTSRLKRVMFV